MRFEHTPNAQIASAGMGQHVGELISDAAEPWRLPGICGIGFRPIVAVLRSFGRQFFLIENEIAGDLLRPGMDAG
ncbi:MAG: hypothetical protein JSS43_18805 [Proteobacteria bacterium]|nr:hypothetical protein [Pseudomonadota bacterium]